MDATRGAGSGERAASVRERILAAARRQLADHGEFSIGAVATEAGVARQTVHYHFRGAKGLRAALAAEGLAAPDEEVPTRERLLEAVERVFSKPGGGVASIETIATEAGLTKGAIYHYFDDRADLLRAVAARLSPVDELAAVLAGTADLPARDGLIALTRAYYAAMGARTDLIRNLAANSSRDPELAQTVMGEIVGRGAPLVLGWFERMVERGELRPIDPSLVIQALFGPVFLAIVLGPAVFDRLVEIGIHPAVANVEPFVDLLLEGVGAAAVQPSTRSQTENS